MTSYVSDAGVHADRVEFNSTRVFGCRALIQRAETGEMSDYRTTECIDRLGVHDKIIK